MKKLVVCIAVSVLCIASAGLILWRNHRENETRRMGQLSDLVQLGLCLHMYAKDHDGEFPDSLSAIGPYCTGIEIFLAPYSETEPGPISRADDWADYVLVTGLTMRSSPDAVLAYARDGNVADGLRCVLFVGGGVAPDMPTTRE